MNDTILEVNNLSIAFESYNESNQVLFEVSYKLKKNEILGIVGESGSGKSVSSLAILGLLPKKQTKFISGEMKYLDNDLLKYSNSDFQELRGNKIAMIFQEPMTSLNPSLICGKQVAEVLVRHLNLTKKEARLEVLSLFEKVKLPDPAVMYDKYPHQISGGQKQRVMIAMAIACKPDVLIADEPTTALDVTVQKEIIALLKSIQQETKMSIIFISHDLALISEISDNVVVMYKGKVVESGSVDKVFKNPENDYTKALINSRPSVNERLKVLPTIQDYLNDTISDELITSVDRVNNHKKIYNSEPLLKVVNVDKEYVTKGLLFTKDTYFKAVNSVSFDLYEGETLGLVGESGCGKSTLGNAILQLDKATSGQIFYKGTDITKISKSELRLLRKEIQLIFQDPYSSLNPRIPVGKAIMEPMKVHKLYKNDAARKAKTIELLERVGLLEEHFYRYPHEFSGGQRQRIGIARTIAVNPKLIICDESVSALDISVQAQVLNLLNELKEKFGFSYIFISHDLAVVKYMSDQLVVMSKGRIEEIGEADSIYADPKTEYTQSLINAIPKGI
ncbi:MAG: ABC transporter ATP-binding protein [Flavobacteriaceae bacterium]|nr:ABC transporter ATP-binding protein [Flavobacteriaceae bacterium]